MLFDVNGLLDFRSVPLPLFAQHPDIVIGHRVPSGKQCSLVLSRYPISRCDTYRDTWVTMRYISRYLSIGVISA